MKFTLIFPSHESSDLSIAALFTPCLTWHRGGVMVANPHPKTPQYVAGDLQKFLAGSGLEKKIADYSQMVTVVVHSTGHGTQQDLDLIIEDIQSMDLLAQVVEQ